MKIETTYICCPATSKPVIHCETRDDSAKSCEVLSPLFAITGIALCLGLASCFASYDARGYDQTARYRPGYRVNALPGGYRSEVLSGSTYYYHEGYYYRPSSGGYIVVDAPRSSRYYADYGRRHQAHQPDPRLDRMAYNREDQRYERGDILTRLPRGYRQVKHRGKSYYQVGERFYQRQNKIYVVVSRPY
jgi:hypothetical protein